MKACKSWNTLAFSLLVLIGVVPAGCGGKADLGFRPTAGQARAVTRFPSGSECAHA